MNPRVGIIQFNAVCPEGNEHPLACGITYEIARRLTTIGGVDANAILHGNGIGPGLVAEGSAELPLSAEKTTGLSVPTLGARYESDYLVIGRAQIADGMLLFYKLYEVTTGRLVTEGSVSGLRSSVFQLLDELAKSARRAIGLAFQEEEEADFNPVFESVDFEAFVEYCLGREAALPQNAMEHFERALSLEPGFRMALVEYLSHCYQIDDISSSMRLLDEYLNAYPEDQEILIAASNLCLAFHVVDEGMVYANRALIQRPGDAEPHVILARFYFAKEMPAEGRVHLSAALASRDASPEALYCLGRYFLDLGDYYQSRDYFERCIQTDPSFYVALRDLQCCYYELGDFALGIQACEKLLESDPTDAGSHYNLGLLYQRLGRTVLAKKFFEEAVRQDPSFYKASFMIAEYHYATGDFDEALARYEQATRIVPDSPETLGRLGDCLYQLGRTSDAYRHYVRARKEDPLFESARHHIIEGAALAIDGDLEGARQRFLRATEVDEDLAEAWNELGGVLLRLGKTEEALNVVRRSIEIEPDHPALLCNLRMCCRCLPLGLRLSGWVRKLARDASERLRYLSSEGIVPPDGAKRRYRRRLRSLTWYGLRG